MTESFDREHAAAFLAAIYTGQPGLLQLCSTGSMVGEFFTPDAGGITAAASYAHQLDQAQRQGIYFRATTLRDKPGRGQRGGAGDTAAVPILWGDVDYGTDGHKGANLPPTRTHAELLIGETGLPTPTILVHSGGGFYPLWRLDRAVDLDQAAELSKRVQALLLAASQAHGWDYGTGVSDLARVLRLPGTVNRKTDQPRPCRVVGGSGVALDPASIPTAPDAPAASAPGATAARPLPPARPHDPSRSSGPLDALAEMPWSDLLGPAGWTLVATEADGAERWLRPGGASSEYSARAFEHNLVVHSDNAGFPAGAGQRLTKARVFAWLHYRGDTSEAARDLVRAAHGNGGSPAARSLPAAVLTAVRTSSDAYGPFGAFGLTPTMRLAVGNPHPVRTTLALVESNPVSAPARPQLAAVPDIPAPDGLTRFLLPPEVWTFSPVMNHINRAGWSRLVSPDAVLHAVFAIVASMLHHGSRVETGKGPSVLSYFLAAIGASGAGKSEALKVARELLADWSDMRFAIIADDAYIDAPLGSGEGIIEAFMGKREEPVADLDGQPVINSFGFPTQVTIRAQVRHNALFHTDEGRQVLALADRKGATILAILCEMWSGSVAGQTNAEAARTRKLEAGTYVVGILLGFQVDTIDALFADEAGGAPQRFAFAPAEYGPFGADLDADIDTPWPGSLHPIADVGAVTVTLGAEHQREVRRAIRAKAAGLSRDGALDGHRMLLRCRTAALLALLHGATHVDANLWALADTITTRSCALRDWLAAQGARKAAAQADARQAATVETTVLAQARIQEGERIARAAGQIVRAVERAGGQLTRGKACNGIRSELRDVRDVALGHAVGSGLLVMSEDERFLTLPEGGEQ